MKKNINIEKTIDFSGMIGEVTAISLEQNLKFVSDDEINGDLIVSGRYKSTAASQLEEEFSEKIPVSISLLEKIDVNSANVDIADFYYDIVDNSSLKCNVILLIDALEIIDDDDVRSGCPLEEDRECDGDPISEKEIEIPKIEKFVMQEKIESNVEEDKNDKERNEDNIDLTINGNVENSNIVVTNENDDIEESSEHNDINDNENLFFNFDNSKESYGTFVVYMVRQNETINSILEKYNTTVEEIEKYNDIKDISIGSKLIIPLLNEEDK